MLPGLVGFLGRGHGRVNLCVGGKWHVREHLLCRRVDDVVPFRRLGLNEVAVDQ
jgi:hypothetical protein